MLNAFFLVLVMLSICAYRAAWTHHNFLSSTRAPPPRLHWSRASRARLCLCRMCLRRAASAAFHKFRVDCVVMENAFCSMGRAARQQAELAFRRRHHGGVLLLQPVNERLLHFLPCLRDALSVDSRWPADGGEEPNLYHRFYDIIEAL